MFAKLLKYEWKANAKLLSILSAAAAVLGVIGAAILSLAFSIMSDPNPVYEGLDTLGSIGLIFLWFFILLSLVVYSLAVNIILAYRFYKTKFTDQGYLTFTLPVSSKQIFLSSSTNMSIWVAISTTISSASMLGSLFIGLLSLGDMGDYFIEALKSIPEMMTISDGVMAAIQLSLSLVMYLLACLTSIVTIHTSIVLGAVLVKKLKILTSIGIYYAINFGMSMLVSFTQYVPSFVMLITPNDVVVGLTQIVILLVQILIYVAIIVVGYKVSIKLMDEKLNLP